MSEAGPGSGERPRILVMNDDGYQSEGLVALAEALEPLGEVWVVAPQVEQSGTSHAISLHRPLRLKKLKERWFAVDGTPTDCAYLALKHLLKGQRPTLAVSGINRGANVAEDVMYSGTVAAAMEASLLGVPAVAFSLASFDAFEFGPAARFARALVTELLGRPLKKDLLLNVNVPGGVEPKGYALTTLGKHTYGDEVVENRDPRGRRYYWIGGSRYEHQSIPGSDCNAVIDLKLVSITPLKTDLTDRVELSAFGALSLPGFPRIGAVPEDWR